MKFNTKTAAFAGAALAVLGLALISKPAISAVYSTPMRNIENPARYPVQVTGSITLPDGKFEDYADIYTVPHGYRLVIDSVSAATNAPADQYVKVDFRSWATVEGVSDWHNSFQDAAPFVQWFPHGSNRHLAWGTSMVRMYADQDGVIQMHMERVTTAGAAGQVFSNAGTGFTGHLVPLP